MRLIAKREKRRLASDLASLEKKGYGVITSSFGALDQFLQTGPQTVYCGFDPTASSLHVGNLIALIGLIHFQRLGHQPIALIGGATALIGDPTHRSVERERLEKEAAKENAEKIAETIASVFENHEKYFWNVDGKDTPFSLKPPIIVNNQDWYSSTNVIDFLYETGRHFRMNSLLGRSSVQARMESQDGMSLTEFVYQVFQSHDWLHLYQTYGCRIQLGGNDQTGNIMSGLHLIHKVIGSNLSSMDEAGSEAQCVEQGDEKLFGVTVPILTTERNGQKIGKSSGGHSLWLREELTSPFTLYQYFYNVWDKEVDRFIRQLTLLSEEEISPLLETDPEFLCSESRGSGRTAQKTLGQHVVRLLHGQRGVDSAIRCTSALFGASTEDLKKLTAEEVVATFPGAGVVEIEMDRSGISGNGIVGDAVTNDGASLNEQHGNRNLTLVDLLLATQHCQKIILAKRPNWKPHVVENKAKTNVLKLISEGSVKINFVKMIDPEFRDFDGCVLTAGGANSETMSSWSLMTISKKHQYVVKWVRQKCDERTNGEGDEGVSL